MPQNDIQNTRPPIAWSSVALPLLVVFAVHLAVLGRYGFGWDELYYVACADHLDWGYIDPPTAHRSRHGGDPFPYRRLLAGTAPPEPPRGAPRRVRDRADRTGARRRPNSVSSSRRHASRSPRCPGDPSILSMDAFDHLFGALAILS